jgi:ABC-type polysaccharide/polyol phosphate transport system ATPase subunit
MSSDSSNGFAISAQDIGKCYHIYTNPKDRLKQAFWRHRKRFSHDFWALKNISFKVKKGESVGIIGQNGSGKSTLLQIIAGVIAPTTGEVIVGGRISSLLELGAGFNFEFTGRENVFFSGALLGFSREEMERRAEEIIDFAEIGPFIDQPVKTYSSGMYVRLAFSCAIHVDPDILIIDEVLAVGDTYFQLKCMDRLNHFQKAEKAILLVTHSPYTIRSLCNTCIWLDEGEIVMVGDALYVADLYNDFMRSRTKGRSITARSYIEEVSRIEGQKSRTVEEISDDRVLLDSRDHPTLSQSDVARVISFRLINGDGHETYRFTPSDTMIVNLTYEVYNPIDGLVMGVAILKNDGYYVCGLNTALDDFKIPSNPGTHRIRLKYPTLSLLGGLYKITFGLFDKNAIINIDLHKEAIFFEVLLSKNIADGTVVLSHEWSIE